MTKRIDPTRDSRLRHGHRRTTASPEYMAWQCMLWRCYCPTNGAFHAYGAKGITVSDEWRGRGGFERFLAHIGTKPSPRHSIDRVDNTRGYEPGNVRWATGREQNLNRAVARTITVGGVTRPVIEWSELLGIEYATIMRRVYRGCSPERCLSVKRHSGWPRVQRAA
jgi:hypothetical protein